MVLDAMIWVAAHLSWIIWALLVLWLPPVLYAMAIDLDVIAAPGSGYPTLRDPALVTGALQLALMLAAALCWQSQRGRAWKFLWAALAMWLAHVTWGVSARLRLDGMRALAAPETWWPVIGVVAAAMLMISVARHFTYERSPR
jgi:hypothetical protein